jgi:hypothetical protein
MIEFETWLPQILGYCEFICADEGVRRAWIDSDVSGTSITSFDELYEQIFDDLDADHFLPSLPFLLASKPELVTAVSRFLDQLKSLDSARTLKPALNSMTALLDSPEWQDLRATAAATLKAQCIDSGP